MPLARRKVKTREMPERSKREEREPPAMSDAAENSGENGTERRLWAWQP